MWQGKKIGLLREECGGGGGGYYFERNLWFYKLKHGITTFQHTQTKKLLWEVYELGR